VAGIQRVRKKQAIEVGNVPANGWIQQVATLWPGGAKWREIEFRHVRIPIYGLKRPYMDIESHSWSDKTIFGQNIKNGEEDHENHGQPL
jgi:hypothetical protein